MSASVLYMSMSVDGFIAGPNDDPSNPGGDGFERLHEWFITPDGEFLRPSGPAGQLFDEVTDGAGAILAGNRAPRSRSKPLERRRAPERPRPDGGHIGQRLI